MTSSSKTSTAKRGIRPTIERMPRGMTEQVLAVDVLAVHPPGEIDRQLLKDARQEQAIALAGPPRDLVDAPAGPGVNWGIHVGQGPLIGRQLTVGVHVPLAQQKHELLLG